MEGRARTAVNLAGYSQGKERASKDMLSLCRATNITRGGCGAPYLTASLCKQTRWFAQLTNRTGASRAAVQAGNSTAAT